MSAAATLDRPTMDGLPGEPNPFVPGALIAGKYLIERELGAGGVGVVALAMHIELEQRVAVKYLRQGVRANPRSIERFKREAKLAASLRSQHVVKVFDVGTLGDGTPYMVMEYLEGEDLSAVVKRGGISVEQAVQWTLEACQALEEAHDIGIVHRDLKPANFFLAKRPNGAPVVKILDFGISKMADAAAGLPAMTRQNEIFGTPYYMSPEQLVASANVDARSDIWAMGVCLYELLTGRLPFEGDDLRQLVSDVLSSVPTPIRDYRSDIPIELAQVVHSCLQYDPGQRPRSVGNLALRITPFASSRYVQRLALAETSEVSGVHDLGWVTSARLSPPSAPEPISQLRPMSAPVSSITRSSSSFGMFAAVGGASLLVGAALTMAMTFGRPQAARASSLVGAEPPHDVVVALPSAAIVPAHIEIVEVTSERAAEPPPAPVRVLVTPAPKPARSSAPVDQFGGRE